MYSPITETETMFIWLFLGIFKKELSVGILYVFTSNMSTKNSFYTKPKPATSKWQNALGAYWVKFLYVRIAAHTLENAVKSIKDTAERKCIVCWKNDSKELTLKQCKGCGMYYCCNQDLSNYSLGGTQSQG
jgi:hypothetical protein